MDLFEKTLGEERIFDGKIIGVRRDRVELPDGSTSFREVVEHPGGVAILPLEADGSILMVRQYRYPAERVLLEIPAGKLERGENPLDCGIRELREEVGRLAGSIESLGHHFASPGYLTETIHLYLATDLTATSQQLDEGEFLTVERIPFEEAVRMVMDGRIEDGKTAVAILKVYAMRKGEAGDSAYKKEAL